MQAPDGRPIYLDLARIKLPLPGIISIMHRIFGVVLSVSIPFLVYLFALSLRSLEGFQQSLDILGSAWLKPYYLLLLWGFVHHLLAGVRYLLIDIEIGVEKNASYKSATVVLWAGIVITLAIVAGAWL
jgi:succinate dehydrogenase / fumarate reductase cytochrome b subunit